MLVLVNSDDIDDDIDIDSEHDDHTNDAISHRCLQQTLLGI